MSKLRLKCYSIANDPDEYDYNDLETQVHTCEYTNGAIFSYSLDTDRDLIHINLLKVPEEEQGKGYGTEIVNRLFKEYEYCEYDVTTYYDKASWWERLGFKETSKDEHWVYMHRQAPADDVDFKAK